MNTLSATTITQEPESWEDALERERREKQRTRQRLHKAASCPRMSPSLSADWIKPGKHQLRFHNWETPKRAMRPYGAEALQLYVVKGPKGVKHPEGAELVAEFKRRVMRVEYEQEDDGKMATYFARWVHRTGETSLWSDPLSMIIDA